MQAPEDAPEEAEDAACVEGGEGELAKEHAEIVAIGGLHGGGGVVRGEHGFFNEGGEAIEVAVVGGGRFGWIGGGLLEEGVLRAEAGELVEADGGGLAQIHGGLARVGGDFDEYIAVGKIVAGEAVFLRAEDESGAVGGGEFPGKERGEIGQGNDGLARLSMGDGARTRYERTGGESLCQSG